MKKVVLLGANGQLGADIALTKPAGVELIRLDIEDLDITDREGVDEKLPALRPDLVINTAAYVRVDDAEDFAEEAFRVNAVAVKFISDACKKAGSALLHISTDYVFDGAKTSGAYSEDDMPNPINTYGISKYAGEILMRNTIKKHYIVRTASLYGKAGASGKGGNFVYSILKRAREGQPLRVIDDMHMSPTYTLDAAREIWTIISERMPFGLYHVTNSGYTSWFELAKEILRCAGLGNEIVPISHAEYKTKAKRPLWSPLESVRGIRLRPWQEAVREFVANTVLGKISNETAS